MKKKILNVVSLGITITQLEYVFEISNVHNERNINLKFVIFVRIRLNRFSGDCKSKKWENKVFIIFKCN